MKYLMIFACATIAAISGCDNARVQNSGENPEAAALIAADMARRAKYALPMPMERFFKGDVFVYGPFSVEELEERSKKEMQLFPDVPQVPFGYGHEKWIEFKKNLLPADKLYEYDTDSHTGSIAAGHGASGIAVVRDSQVIAVFQLSVY